MAGRTDGGAPQTVLEHLLWQRDQTYEELVAEFLRVAAGMGEQATMSPRHLRRLAKGQAGQATPVTRRVLQAMFGQPFAGLVTPWTSHGDLIPVINGVALNVPPQATQQEMLTMAAHRAKTFALLTGQADLNDETLEQVADDVRLLCTAYPQRPLPEILGDLVTTQDTLFSLLEHRQRPAHARQLYLLSGITGGLLAKASHDMSEPHAALTQARTAYLCADMADHNGLRAWIRGLASLVTYWDGRPRESVRYAQAGASAAAAAGSTAGVWLAVSEARAWASLGNAGAAREAIDRAERAWDGVAAEDGELDQMGGIATFTRSRQLYYAADALAWLPSEAEAAEAYSAQAVDAYADDSKPDWAFGDAAGSDADLAVARVYRGELDGAAEAMAPVLNLPPAQRIRGIIASARHVATAIERAGRSEDSAAADLQEHIEVFVRTPVKALPR
jgi:hypothetical protein